MTGTSVSWGNATSGPLVTQPDGIRLLPAGRTKDLPWLGIDELTLTFISPVSLTAADITVLGINVGDYGPVTVGIGSTTIDIFLAVPIAGPDRVTVTISNPAITTYTRRLDVLPATSTTTASSILQTSPGFATNGWVSAAPNRRCSATSSATAP